MSFAERITGMIRYFRKNKGVTVAVVADPQEVPEKKEIGTISPELMEKFEELQTRHYGIHALLDKITKQLGSLEIERKALWKEVYKELNLENDEGTFTLDYKTGLITKTE